MAPSNFREAFFELWWICIHSYCLKSMTDRGESTLLNESVLSASWPLLFRTVITKWTWKIDQFLSSIFGVESLRKRRLTCDSFQTKLFISWEPCTFYLCFVNPLETFQLLTAENLRNVFLLQLILNTKCLVSLLVL